MGLDIRFGAYCEFEYWLVVLGKGNIFWSKSGSKLRNKCSNMPNALLSSGVKYKNKIFINLTSQKVH